MGVRLNKVLSELNIGLQTAVDFLKYKKELGEVKDEMTPNTKISDEQYQALVDEFKGGKAMKAKEIESEETDTTSSGVKVIGMIDLSAINQDTRPKKKSKEEKRKERKERGEILALLRKNIVKSKLKDGVLFKSFSKTDWIYEGLPYENLTLIVDSDYEWGYIDQSGTIVIPCQWDDAGNFSEGLARVRTDYHWGFIDQSGEIVIPCQWDDAGDFSEGLARVRDSNGKWGYIDQSGAIVIPCQWDDAWAFSDGLARVKDFGDNWFCIDNYGAILQGNIDCVSKSIECEVIAESSLINFKNSDKKIRYTSKQKNVNIMNDDILKEIMVRVYDECYTYPGTFKDYYVFLEKVQKKCKENKLGYLNADDMYNIVVSLGAKFIKDYHKDADDENSAIDLKLAFRVNMLNKAIKKGMDVFADINFSQLPRQSDCSDIKISNSSSSYNQIDNKRIIQNSTIPEKKVRVGLSKDLLKRVYNDIDEEGEFKFKDFHAFQSQISAKMGKTISEDELKSYLKNICKGVKFYKNYKGRKGTILGFKVDDLKWKAIDELLSFAIFPALKNGKNSFQLAIEQLASKALPEKWYYGTSKSGSNPILTNYFLLTFQRLRAEDKEHFKDKTWKTKIRISSNEDKVLFNTGLVDSLYDPIYALFTRNPNKNSERKWMFSKFVGGRDKEMQNLTRDFGTDLPKPAHYYNSTSELVYNIQSKIGSYNWDHFIDHCERLPIDFLEDIVKSFRGMFDFERPQNSTFYKELAEFIKGNDRILRNIKNRIEVAIDDAIKRVRWNFKTAIPIYYPGQKQISLLLPLSLTTEDNIDVALVLEATENGAYIAHTILTLQMAYTNARLITRPDSDWLTAESIVNVKNYNESEDFDE